MTATIERQILDCFNEYKNRCIHIAYSGGVDSQVLLHATTHLISQGQLTNTVKVCHIHHGLSQYADNWQQFAKQQSLLYKVPFITENVILKDTGEGIEAQAREARYNALVNFTQLNDVIATGHHSDDQAETFLLALKRGSGTLGLGAMSKTRELSQRILLRPLLDISRNEIESYAREHQLEWIEDESNNNTDFDRNFLRHDVLPILKQRWPAILTTIQRSAQHCQDAELLINEIAQQDLNECLKNEKKYQDGLLIEPLLVLSELRFNHVIRRYLKVLGHLMPSQAQLAMLHQQLSASVDKVPEVIVGKQSFRRYKNTLYLTQCFTDISQWQYNLTLTSVLLDEPKVVDLPDQVGTLMIEEVHQSTQVTEQHKQIIYVPNDSTLSIQFSHKNPICLPDYRQKSRSLKKVLQELSMPPWQRKRQPFIFLNCSLSQAAINDENLVLACVAGQFICQPFLKPLLSEQAKVKAIQITFNKTT